MKILKILLAITLFLSGSNVCSADQCLTHGDRLNQRHGLSSDSIDPYSFLMPQLSDAQSLATSYDLDIKVRGIDDFTQLQFKTYDNRGAGAGYTSPYLWEVGKGPGYQSPYQMTNSPNGSGAQYSPFPLPVRR